MHIIHINTLELVILIVIFIAPYIGALYLVASALKMIKQSKRQDSSSKDSDSSEE